MAKQKPREIVFSAIALVLLVGYLVAMWVPGPFGVDVIRITAGAPESVAANRAVFETKYGVEEERFGRRRRNAVVAIYGQAVNAEPVRYVFVEEERLIRPPEAPSIALLPWHEGDEQLLTAAVWGYYTTQLGYVVCVAWLLSMLGAGVFTRKKGGG